MSVYIKSGSGQGNVSNIGQVPGMSFILRCWRSAVRRWERRKMIAVLARLDDRVLWDIGLCRGEIEDFVNGLSRDEPRTGTRAENPSGSHKLTASATTCRMTR